MQFVPSIIYNIFLITLIKFNHYYKINMSITKKKKTLRHLQRKIRYNM